MTDRTPPRGTPRIHNLAAQPWTVAGHAPFHWALATTMEVGFTVAPEIPPVPARVPGSVQAALRAANLLPDWNIGLNARDCEWVEHRHWSFETTLPDLSAHRLRLRCLGLDGPGVILLNGTEIGRFDNAFIPYQFDLPALDRHRDNKLQIVFTCPPRWLGQIGHTSQMTEWKPRFNYTWDWSPRLVQLGIWDDITLETDPDDAIETARCWTAGRSLHVTAAGTGCRLSLANGDRIVKSADFDHDIVWHDLPVELWWPNGLGAQPLYTVTLHHGAASRSWRVGFKSIEWRPCSQAPAGADPWLCVVNGQPIFLQGVNWTPIRPNFADVSVAETRARLQTYRDLGCNLLRVWGGAVLEKESFYDLCDELGLLVWQEFPLSSSALDNWPPEDPRAIADLTHIAASYITRRQHHVSLLCWCGGNELQGALDGGKVGIGKPTDTTHPLLHRLAAVVRELDPSRRFLPTSASGPRFMAAAADFGKGLHWDVHGPWAPLDPEYWDHDDALFRSEVGAPGASPTDLLHATAGDLSAWPPNLENPLWRRTAWWIQWPDFLNQHGREPRDLDEFVTWSQRQQADALALAVHACQRRFPACGGILLWMGHDCFPCTANTAILDFHGRPKPAAAAVGTLFREMINRAAAQSTAPAANPSAARPDSHSGQSTTAPAGHSTTP